MNEKTLRRITIILIVGIAFIILAPFLLTRSLGFISFRETGTIGDTIGGITAPITSLLGSVLVFYALKAQIEANKIIQSQIEQQQQDEIQRKLVLYISEQVNVVRNDINEFSYTEVDSDYSGDVRTKHFIPYKGAEAIHKFVNTLTYLGETHDTDPFIKYPKLSELYNILESIKYLIESINVSKTSDNDKQFFKSLLSYQFKSKIRAAFLANAEHRAKNIPPCKKCGKRHSGIPEKIFELVDEIESTLK